MSVIEFLDILAIGAFLGIVVVLLAIYGRLAWQHARRAFSKPRWRIEEVRCNKCQNSPEPGFLHYESFNPATGDVEQARFACDRCKQTGTIKIVVMADDATHDEHERIAEELRELGHIALLQPDRIKRESEVESE